jgi:hypothetical protein
VLAELGMMVFDPGYCLADRAGHAGSSALGRGCGSSMTTTEAECAGELSDEEVAFGVGLCGPLGVPIARACSRSSSISARRRR